MTSRSISRFAAAALVTIGVMAMTALPAGASTSQAVVHRSDGVAAAEVRFGSGYHAGHHGPPERGFNAFVLKDLVCGDGWGVGVAWQLSDGSSSQKGPADCGEEVVHETGQAGSVILEFQWRPYIWRQVGAGELKEYGDWQQDWMGSNSVDRDSEWFGRTTVYRDTYDGHKVKTFTVSMWPTARTRRTDLLFLKTKWNEVLTRTPLPPSLTAAQRSSLYKQFWCHAKYGKGPAGGTTWDLESTRPDIPWWQVDYLVLKHECNW